jgi:hypothetical protein
MITKDQMALDCYLLQTFNKIREKIHLSDIAIKPNSLQALVEKEPLKVECIAEDVGKKLGKMQLLISDLQD